jgi:hypothetical protein
MEKETESATMIDGLLAIMPVGCRNVTYLPASAVDALAKDTSAQAMPCCCPSSPLPRARPSPLSRASRHKGLQQASRRANLLARSVPGRLEQGAG